MATSNVKNLKLSIFGVNATSSNMKAAAVASPDIGDATIPIIRSKDNAKQLPTYSAAMQRSAEEYLAAEDLDNIQLELEALLSSVALRYRVLKSEYESIDKDERRNDRRIKYGPSSASTTIGPPGNNINIGDKQPASPTATTILNCTSNPSGASSGKRKRDDGTTVRKSKHQTSTLTKLTKNAAKNSPMADNNNETVTDFVGTSSHAYIQKISLPKNDTPNKFWLSVEPYCMPLTNEDLRLLDDLLDQYSGPLVPPIPDLGPHYASVWANEDLKDIQHNSNRLKPHNTTATTSTTNTMLKKADVMLEECVTGPLTQRLVSVFLEEQLIQNPNDLVSSIAADSSNSSSENTHSTAQINAFRTLSLLRNGVDIEKRVKKELIEQGILDANDFPNDDEDEIHMEIKRVLAELSSVAEYNGAELKRLHDAATDEIKRLEIKRKLDAVDQEILETYKRTMQNKSKRKPMTPEEQQEIYRLTSEQKALSDQLERVQPTCLFE